MYILLFLLILGIVTYAINKTNNVEASDEFLKWTRNDLLMLGGAFLSALVMQVLDSYFALPFLVVPVYALFLVILLFYVNKNREKHIQDYKQQVERIFEACQMLVPDKELDLSNMPFQIIKDKKNEDQISEIHLTIVTPNKFNDGNCTQVTFTLNRFFPYYQWKYELDFPAQVAKFIGEPIPPKLAMWKGSDFRPPSFLPLGIGGAGEVGFDFGTKGDYGESSYVNGDGERLGRVSLSKAPQSLVVGSTGGGKYIFINQPIW